MGFDPKTDALIISNMRVLDEASARLDVLTELVWKKLQSSVTDHYAGKVRAKSRSDWRVGDWSDDDGWWLAKSAWRDPETEGADEDYEFWIAMDWGQGDNGGGTPEEDAHYLTRLLGVGKGHVRLKLDQNVLKAGEWKRFRADEAELFRQLALPLDQSGMPQVIFKIDPDKLIIAIEEDNFDEAFEPFRSAIKRFDDVSPTLDRILTRAKRRRDTKV